MRTGSPIRSVFRNEAAQAMAEYALILGLVTLVALVTFAQAAGRISGLYDVITAALP